MTEVLHFLATAGGGPAECEAALEGILERFDTAVAVCGLTADIDAAQTRHGIAHALVTVSGPGARDFGTQWTGTHLWRCNSPFRHAHKRKNWFVGFFELPPPKNGEAVLPEREITFESFRAGGPGGQHQNTTDSAVRARWKGYTATARSERSQHRNKALAVERLRLLVQQEAASGAENSRRLRHTMHQEVSRGNPVKTFSGPKFREV